MNIPLLQVTTEEKYNILKLKNDKKNDNCDNNKVSYKVSLSYEEYRLNNQIIKKFKIPELKIIAKQYKIPITGTKIVLINRIKDYFNRTFFAIKIQRFFKRYINRLFVILRGPAIKDRSICVNESDGYTLEPLNEISFDLFYSYKDQKNFIYGFDILSLLQIYKKNGKIINPYTRERFDNKLINDIICLGNIIRIIKPELFIDETPVNRLPNINSYIHNRIQIQSNQTYNEEQILLMNKLHEIKNRPINTRINDLFIEIDLLGNYTHSYWFTDLERTEYIRFFRLLHNLWNFRGQLSYETKKNICQLYDPFLNIRLPNSLFDMSIEQIKETCINVMEDMIYCGIDTEYRKIGALHVLSILTIVSIPARNNLLWLYESLMY